MPPVDQDDNDVQDGLPTRMKNLIYAIKFQHDLADFVQNFEYLSKEGNNFFNQLSKWREGIMGLNIYQLALLYLRHDISQYLYRQCVRIVPHLFDEDLPNKFKFYQNFHFKA